MHYVPALSREQIEEATHHHHGLWGSGRSQEEHTTYNFAQLDRAGPELLRYVGLVDESGLVASLKRYALLLRDPQRGGVLRTVGIGAVFTRPSARRRGAASALLQEVLREATDLAYDAALLHSDIDPDFYARLGFVALPALEHHARPEDLPEAGALAVRPAEPADLDRLIAWYEAGWSSAGAMLRSVRSRAIWRYFRWRNRIRGEWILSEGDRDVGYLIAARDEPLRDMPDPRAPGLFWVDEWAAPGVAADRVWATVRALAAREGALDVGAWLPPHQESAYLKPRPRTSAFSMIAPLSPALTVEPSRAFLGAFEHF